MDYRKLMEMDIPAAAAVVSFTDAWKIEKVNAEFVKLSGYTERELDDDRGQLVLDRDRYLFEETLEQAYKGADSAEREIRINCADHTTRWVGIRCSLLSREDEVSYLILVFWDIHKQKTGEPRQKILNQKYEMMEKLSHEYPFDLDVAKWVMLRSHNLMELRGNYEAGDVYYPVDEEVLTLHPADRALFLETMREAAREEKSGCIDTRFNLEEDGMPPRYMCFRTYYKSVVDKEGRIERIAGRSFNIDTDEDLREELRRDSLTKLFNKMEVKREISSFLNDNPEGIHVLLLIDIDNFKGINDNFGHTFGDTVLIDVANIIKAQFRKNDVVGRVGGDEFLVFMKNTTLEKAVEKAQYLCRLLSKEYTGGEMCYRISASIGVAVSEENGGGFGSLLEKADYAMCTVKQAGKNGYEIADAKRVGEIRSKVRKIESRERIGQEDREFIASAVSLIAHAKNLDGSLNMLLKQIAQRYQLDLVAVLENSAAGEEMSMNNYYSEMFHFYDKVVFPRLSAEIEAMKPGDSMVCSMAQVTESKELRECFENRYHFDLDKDFSAVIGKYEYVENLTGQIVYLSMDKDRKWQKHELEMFRELTRMMAIFVSLRYRIDESQEQIRYIQNRDQLTNLYNQEAFRQNAVQILRNPEPDKIYAVEYLDINNFGYVNENYGYKIGDNILKMYAEDIMEQPYFRVGCRLYSDFFLLLCADDSEEELEEHLRSRNQRFTNMQNHRYPNSGMGVTAGVYIWDLATQDIDQAIENATLAWKHAKNINKRDITFYDAGLRTKRAEEQRIIGEFFEALYRDDFCMYLQPKFKLKERDVYGAEALARWKRPDGTVLSPACFIDSLEKIGYITELDFYIYEEVLKTLEKWDKQKRRQIVVSTNFSGRHFDTDGEDFLNRIQHILSKYSVPPQCVEIEVTEGVLVQNVSVLKRSMDRLHEIGFRVAIDDFGTGYSSLSVLADMPADVVKIDKSFIDDMSGQKLELLYEIGRMVRILQKDIIIEGVETQEQESLLYEGGFTCGQGYLCNCPVPIGEFERLYL